MAAPVPQGAATLQPDGNTNSHSAFKPTGAAIGELLLTCLTIRSNATVVFNSVPPGWTFYTQSVDGLGAGGSGMVGVIYWKFVDAGDAGTTSWAWGTTTSNVSGNAMIRISGANTITPIEDVTFATTGSSTSPHSFPSVTALGVDRLLLCSAGATAKPTYGPWGGSLAEQWDGSSGTASSTRSSGGATEALSASGASGTRSVTTSVSAWLMMQSILIAPLAPPSAPTGLTATAKGG